MHHRPYQKKNCHSREGGNPRIYGGERKVQLIMFTYLFVPISIKARSIKYSSASIARVGNILTSDLTVDHNIGIFLKSGD
jgi:hypothetical protein